MKKQYTKPAAQGIDLHMGTALLNNSTYEVDAQKKTEQVLSNERAWDSSNWQSDGSEED